MTHRGAQTISGGIGVVSALALAGIVLKSTLILFFVVSLAWILFLVLCDLVLLVKQGRATALPLALSTALGLLGLLTIVDHKPLQWTVVALAGIIFSVIWSGALLGHDGSGHTRKLVRRTTMMLWVFAVYALVTTLYALAQFFPHIPFWLIAMLCGVILAFGAWMIWRMYVDLPLRRAVLWMVVIGLVMIEYVWVLYLLPFSFVTSGFLVVWAWYIVQLFVRFHLGNKGIVWKHQRWFLLINFILYVGLLVFIIRWV